MLNRVPKARVVLQNLLPTISFRVLAAEMPSVEADDAQHHHGKPNRDVDSGTVMGRVLGAEDQGSRDTADTTQSDKVCRAERALPLPSDIVGLYHC